MLGAFALFYCEIDLLSREDFEGIRGKCCGVRKGVIVKGKSREFCRLRNWWSPS